MKMANETAVHVNESFAPQSVFSIGDTVQRNSFTDCFKKFHPTEYRLTVIDIRFAAGRHIAGYHRITARSSDGSIFEGAERFFSVQS